MGKRHPHAPCPQAYTQAEAKGERDNPDLHFNKAVVLKYQADFPEAYGELLKAMELDPSLKVAPPLSHIIGQPARPGPGSFRSLVAFGY